MIPTSMPKEFRAISALAVSEFLGEHAPLTFIRHGQNVTSRVDATSGQYLLRVHLPTLMSADASQALMDSTPGLESECAWLQALAEETELKIQQPVASPGGGHVLELPLAPDAELIPCTLLHWLPGEILEGERSMEQAGKLGEVLATLQNHAEQWVPPVDFVRPSLGLESWLASAETLQGLLELRVVTPEDRALVLDVMEKATQELGPLERQPERVGLIHADLHESNYLVDGENISPIDFGRAGFGPWLYDLAESIGHLHPAQRRAMLEAYSQARPFEEVDLQHVEGYVVMSIVDHYGLRANDPSHHAELAKNTPNFAKYFRGYLEGSGYLLG